MRAARLLLLAASLSLAIGPSVAQEGATRPEDPRRARWRSLSERERQELRERYERFRSLGEAERRRLREKASRLEGLRERLEEELPEEVIERLRALPPAERWQASREIVRRHLDDRFRALREILPEPAVERLRRLPAEERRREMERLLLRAKENLPDRWLERTGRRMPPGVRDRLKGLPPPERFAESMRLRKEAAIEELEARPEVLQRMPREAWEDLKRLEPPEFFRRLWAWRAAHLGRPGAPPPPWARPGDGSSPPRLPLALRAPPEEQDRLRDLPPDGRRAEIERIARERARARLLDAGVPTAEVERIVSLPFEALLREFEARSPRRR